MEQLVSPEQKVILLITHRLSAHRETEEKSSEIYTLFVVPFLKRLTGPFLVSFKYFRIINLE